MQLKQNDKARRIIQEHSQEDFDSADAVLLREFAGECDISNLQSYLIVHRQTEKQLREQEDAAETKNRPPFAHLSSPRLLELRTHPHPSIVAAASEELARRELIHFTQHTYSGYMANWHHKQYAAKLDAFLRGEIQNLMVFMPPQHGKSELCSRRMPAKLLGDRPNCRVAIVTYNHVFASKFNRDVQRIIDSDAYRVLFPETTLGASNVRTVAGNYLRNADEFEIVGHRGGLVSVGVGGGLTGRPVDVLIIDDPYKSQKDAWSPTVRRSIQDWYDTVATTRLHNKSQQLLTLTRWHEEDLAGQLLKTEPEKWEIVKFPAIKEGDPLDYDPREPGEALWPEVHSLERMLAIKSRNQFVFGAMYQQDPKPAEGLLFPPDSLHYFSMEDIADIEWDSIIAAADVADKGTDFYCMPIAGISNDRLYILDVVFTSEPVKVSIPLTLSKLREWRPHKLTVESNNGGSIFANSIREKKTTATTIEDKNTGTNKETRILMASGQVQEYCYFREDYATGSQYEAFMGALTSYRLAGGNAHDDAPDGVTMLIEMVHPIQQATDIIVLEDTPGQSSPRSLKERIKQVFGRLTNTRSEKW